MSQWESWVERQIREATERGEFADLPGIGKPLDLGNPDDPDWWIKRLVRREGIDTSQALHPTLALRREAKTYPAALADIRTEDQVRELVRDFNQRVVQDRLRPVRGAAMPPVAPRLDVEEMVTAWRAMRAADETANDAEKLSDTAELARPREKASRRPTRFARWWRALFAAPQPTDAMGADDQSARQR
ncbi:MAG: DUF1992 domain-containing protein [Austwickia sp.]|nr:MAG: DUF1992 domain-containing protein [Austwickia sp.]